MNSVPTATTATRSGGDAVERLTKKNHRPDRISELTCATGSRHWPASPPRNEPLRPPTVRIGSCPFEKEISIHIFAHRSAEASDAENRTPGSQQSQTPLRGEQPPRLESLV